MRFILIVFLMLPALSRAQNFSYAGKVTDEVGTPLPWALIQAKGSTVMVQSGLDGSFSLGGTVALSPRPRPQGNSYVTAMDAELEAADAYLSDGRRVEARADGDSPRFFRAAASLEALNPSPGTGNHAISVSAKSSAGSSISASAEPFQLTVSQPRFEDGIFPETSATATGLVLRLRKSATDTATFAPEKKLCLDTVNACRAKLGLKSVAWSTSLEAFADQGARYDAARNVAHGHFSAFSKSAVPADAENALPGWPLKDFKNVGAIVQQGTQQMWAEGPGGGHYENIRGDQTQLGCGIYVTPAGNVWVIQDFK